jgi:hypothetical protein
MNKNLYPFYPFKPLFIFIAFIVFSLNSHALFTEIGLSYTYKKTTFDANNNIESQMATGSLSFYLWEKVALETSYSEGLAVRKEKDAINPVRTSTQSMKIYGADLILGFADRTATFQPFIKGGIAYVMKKLTIQDEGQPAFSIDPKSALSPSYGLGLKFKLSEAFSLSVGADVWQTPLEDGTTTSDLASRAGLSFAF